MLGSGGSSCSPRYSFPLFPTLTTICWDFLCTPRASLRRRVPPTCHQCARAYREIARTLADFFHNIQSTNEPLEVRNVHRRMASAAHVGFTFFLDTLEGALGRLDRKRELVSSALVFGLLVTLISKETSVRFCFSGWQAKSEAAPATVGGESFFGMPLGFLDKAREGDEGL